MDYIEWVELVAQAHARLATGHHRIIGLREVRVDMGLSDEADDAVWTALEDLDALGIVDIDSPEWVKTTQNTRALRSGSSLRGLWPTITEQYLDSEQQAFMTALVELAQRPGVDFADVSWTPVQDIYGRLGWSTEDHEPYALTESLEALGQIRRHAMSGGFISVCPTYRGVVRMTQKTATEWQARLGAMVEEWETVSVDFKRELALGTDKLNAEFAHDVIALATAKASGAERYLVLGYDDDSHEFTTALDPAITQNRLEQILDGYARPAPAIRLVVFEHVSGAGMVAILVVRRDPAQLVYRMKKGGGKIKAEDVYVRHGSHVVRPDPAELADLVAEGDRARASA